MGGRIIGRWHEVKANGTILRTDPFFDPFSPFAILRADTGFEVISKRDSARILQSGGKGRLDFGWHP
jgi:hypothetical protein